MDIGKALEILAERKWEHPPDYGGFSPEGDYVVLTRTRDGGLLDESNWHAADALLVCQWFGASPYDDDFDAQFAERPTCYSFRAGHWACGWVEYMLVRRDAPDPVLIEAARIVSSLEDYPILDDDDYSQREYDLACETWEGGSIRDRIEWCHRGGISIFAARHDWLPGDPTGALFETLTAGAH